MSNLHNIFNVIALFLLLLLLLLLQNPIRIHCHTKGIRPRRSSRNKGIGLSTNMSRVEFSEQQFMKWVDFVGSLKHSVFKTAKNKLSASYTLHVDKNPALGDFTSIQEAIDSLPSTNLVRVLIKVHAGVYK
jgi:pectinesterase